MWSIKSFNELSREELFFILKARVDVFVVEQECAYPEIDDLDLEATHIFQMDEMGIHAYCRVIPTEIMTKIGRVLVTEEFRSSGLGRDLVTVALDYCQKEFPDRPVYAQAQAYLEDFYRSFGFKPTSDVYLEDDIPHIDMMKETVDN